MRNTEQFLFPFKTLPELLDHQAKVLSAKPALEAPSRQALTYANLWEQVASAVKMLKGASVTPADRVALLLPNGPEMAVAFLAAASAASAAPLNPAYRTKELDFYFSDLRPRVLLFDSRLDTPARERRELPCEEGAPGVGGGGLRHVRPPVPRSRCADRRWCR